MMTTHTVVTTGTGKMRKTQKEECAKRSKEKCAKPNKEKCARGSRINAHKAARQQGKMRKRQQEKCAQGNKEKCAKSNKVKCPKSSRQNCAKKRQGKTRKDSLKKKMYFKMRNAHHSCDLPKARSHILSLSLFLFDIVDPAFFPVFV